MVTGSPGVMAGRVPKIGVAGIPAGARKGAAVP